MNLKKFNKDKIIPSIFLTMNTSIKVKNKISKRGFGIMALCANMRM